MTLRTLALYREWERAVDARTATGELAVTLSRQAEDSHERGVFLSVALQYARTMESDRKATS